MGGHDEGEDDDTLREQCSSRDTRDTFDETIAEIDRQLGMEPNVDVSRG